MLRYLTAGESHGQALMGILEGLPSGISLRSQYLQQHMRRRKLGYGRGNRQKIEDDHVDILCGVRHGKTLGAPIGLLIHNKDWKNWQQIMAVDPVPGPVKRQVGVPRPGHADLVGGIKYDHADMRNVLERSSARETAMRVALGTIARRFLEELGIHIASRVTQIGAVADPTPLNVPIDQLNAAVDERPLRCLGTEAETAMIAAIDEARTTGNTLGGIFEVYAVGVPVALGSYSQWDRRLEGALGEAFLSMNAIKGVELGIGFEAGRVFGSEAHDEMAPGDSPLQVRYLSNRAGGITGGMSTGQPIVMRAAMKPIATLMRPLDSVNAHTGEAAKAHIERSDTCAVPAAAVICEALMALVLAEAILDKFGADSMRELKPRIKAWVKKTRPTGEA
jgi:chorismate synthase